YNYTFKIEIVDEGGHPSTAGFPGRLGGFNNSHLRVRFNFLENDTRTFSVDFSGHKSWSHSFDTPGRYDVHLVQLDPPSPISPVVGRFIVTLPTPLL
ncbi:MAG TPA: hypothetical protein VEL11_09490, partial [Candidatus Bathyarchaeia archaeon]|nr:hypothetical protein [Candidatus Bathyarchaeia archaeon]